MGKTFKGEYAPLKILHAYIVAKEPIGYQSVIDSTGHTYSTVRLVTRVLCGLGMLTPARGGPNGTIRFKANLRPGDGES